MKKVQTNIDLDRREIILTMLTHIIVESKFYGDQMAGLHIHIHKNIYMQSCTHINT